MGAIGHYRRISERLACALANDAELRDVVLVSETVGGANIPAMSRALLAAVEREPKLAEELPGNTLDVWRAAALLGKGSKKKAPRALTARGFAQSDFAPAVDIEKDAPDLQRALPSVAEPGSAAHLMVAGGSPIGDDLGYGPAHLFDAETVQRIAAALAAIPEGKITGSSFEPSLTAPAEPSAPAKTKSSLSQLMETYMARRPSSGDAVRDTFVLVRDYFQAASAAGQCVLRWFS